MRDPAVQVHPSLSLQLSRNPLSESIWSETGFLVHKNKLN